MLESSSLNSTTLKQPAVAKKAPIGKGERRARLAQRFKPSGRLFRTSAFRLALIYATLFSALSAATLGFIYWSTRAQIESQVDTRLRLETDYLINLYKSGAVEELLEAIQRRNQIDTYERFYSLTRGNPQSTSEDDTPGSGSSTSTDQPGEPLRLQAERTHSTKNMGDVIDLPTGQSKAISTGTGGGA